MGTIVTSKMTDITAGELKEDQKDFDKYDQDGSGSPEKPEIFKALEELLGHEPDEEAFEDFMQEADTDQNGKIDFKEFMCVVLSDSEWTVDGEEYGAKKKKDQSEPEEEQEEQEDDEAEEEQDHVEAEEKQDHVEAKEEHDDAYWDKKELEEDEAFEAKESKRGDKEQKDRENKRTPEQEKMAQDRLAAMLAKSDARWGSPIGDDPRAVESRAMRVLVEANWDDWVDEMEDTGWEPEENSDSDDRN